MTASRLVLCEEHGDAPGYLVCVCIVDGGAHPEAFVPPGPSSVDAGMILCSGNPHQCKDLVLTCQHCARARGWVSADFGAAHV